MAHGKAKSTLLGIQGVVGHKDAPDWSFIYETSLIRDPKWNIGDRVVLPDGREFRYAKSSGICKPGSACVFADTAVAARTAAGIAQVVGDREVTHPAVTHDAFDEDELRGGYIVIGVGAGDRNNIQFRGIIGNAATAKDVAFKIYLDGPLTTKIVASTSDILAYKNPYAALKYDSGDNRAKAGPAAAHVDAANMYFWVQKAGFTAITPTTTVDANDIGCCWVYNGSVINIGAGYGSDGAGIPGTNNTQYAGYCVGSDKDDLKPLFMLNG